MASAISVDYPSGTHCNDNSTGRIQIRVLTNCQAISTEIGTDSLKM